MINNKNFSFSNHFGLIQQAEQIAMNNYKISSKRIQFIKANIEFFRDLMTSIPELTYNPYLDKPIISVDGSNQQINASGHLIYVPITVARVYLNPKQYQIQKKYYPYFEKIRIIDEEGHAKIEENENFIKFYGTFKSDIKKVEKSVDNNINFIMLKYETEALNDIANEVEECIIKKPSLILIDGPLIDPPINSINSLIKLRCNVFKRLLDLEINIVGVTKRIYQDVFLNHLKACYNNQNQIINGLKNFYNDVELFTNILYNINQPFPLRSKLFNYDFLSINDNNPLIKEWKLYKNHGFSFLSCYLIKNIGSRLIKLDIATFKSTDKEKKKEYEKIIDCIVKLIYPGLSIPFPILLAHNYANIKEETILLLKKIILSKSVLKDPFLILANPPLDDFNLF
ncbi:MAG: DNA double-strand break repair nuclease NurA [Promethearchaeota archaeon]